MKESSEPIELSLKTIIPGTQTLLASCNHTPYIIRDVMSNEPLSMVNQFKTFSMQMRVKH